MKKPLGTKLAAVLTAIQTWRVVGGIFIEGAYAGWLPAAFGLVAGWGDLLVGATAPIVSYALARRVGLGPWVTAIVWNALGIADLVVAVSVGVLSQALAMRSFPLVLVPTIAVPILIVAHVVTIVLLVRERSRKYYLGIAG